MHAQLGENPNPRWLATAELRHGLPRVILLTFLWWLLTGGEPGSWVIGAPAVLAAAATSLALRSSTGGRFRLTGLVRFVPYFLWRSTTGSVAVAWRALHPGLPIAPSFEQYLLRLPAEGSARVFFANTVNLLPGTLSADLGADLLTVHVLNDRTTALVRLRELETRVADLFGHELASTTFSGERADHE